VDMWSIGCIVGELLGGKPMFPGTSTMNQLDRIIEVTGRPTQEDIESIQSEFAATMLETLPDSEPRPLSSLFPNADEDALTLLHKLLMFNPTKRITAEEALAHPYLAQFHVLEEEIVCLKAIEIPINDNEKGTVDDYRDKLYQNIVKVNVEKKEKRAAKKKSSKKKDSEKKSSSSSRSKKSSSSATPAGASPEKDKKKKRSHKDKDSKSSKKD